MEDLLFVFLEHNFEQLASVCLYSLMMQSYHGFVEKNELIRNEVCLCVCAKFLKCLFFPNSTSCLSCNTCANQYVCCRVEERVDICKYTLAPRLQNESVSFLCWFLAYCPNRHSQYVFQEGKR